MTDDELRTALAVVLDGEYGSDAALLDALLPAARAYAAHQLRAAATDLTDDDESDPAYLGAAQMLRARATALERKP
jgi:hypothetical protein